MKARQIITSSGLRTCAEHLYVRLHTHRTLPLGEALMVKPKLSQIPGLF